MSGFIRKICVFVVALAACFAGIRLYAAGSTSVVINLDDSGAKVASVPSYVGANVNDLTSLPYKPAYGYAGHFSGQNCTGTQYIDYKGKVLVHPSGESVIAYACWIPASSSSYVRFVALDDAGGSGGAFISPCTSATMEWVINSTYVSAGARGDWAFAGSQDDKSGTSVHRWVTQCAPSESWQNITASTQIITPNRSGFVFRGYYTGQNGSGYQVVDQNGYMADPDSVFDYLSSTGPTKLYAKWATDNSGNYRITLDDDGGSGGQVASNALYIMFEMYGQCYASASSFSTLENLVDDTCIQNIYQTPTKSGYTFGGYYTGTNGSGVPIIDSSGNVVGSNTYFTSNATIHAKWTPNIYTVTLDHGNPTNSPSPSTVYLKHAVGWYSNSAATTPIYSMTTKPTKTNYNFAGYFTGQNGSGTMVVDSDGNFKWSVAAIGAITSNQTIYAYWSPAGSSEQWVTLTINDDNATTNSSPTVLYRNVNSNQNQCSGYRVSRSCNATIVTQITPPTKTNYVFAGHWTDNRPAIQWSNSNGTILYDIVEDTTVYAQWNENTQNTVYTIKLDKNGGDHDLDIFAKNGIGWFRDSSGTYSIYSSIFSAQNLGGAGLTKPIKSGYSFSGYWTETSGGDQIIDGDGNILLTIPTYTQTTSLYAHWVRDTAVTLNPNNGTACGTTSVTATYGTAMPTLNCAPTRSGYDFTGYFSQPSGGTRYYYADRTSAHNWDQNVESATIYAQWTAVSSNNHYVNYYCDKSDQDAGIIAYQDVGTYGQSYTVKTRAQVGCSAPANEKFMGWDFGGEATIVQPGSVITFNYSTDVDATAYYLGIRTVTLNHGSPDNTPLPNTVYFVRTDGWYSDPDATIEATVSPVPDKYGYDFLGYWTTETSGGTQVVNDGGRFIDSNFHVPNLRTIYARYSQKTYRVTLNDQGATTPAVPALIEYDLTNGWTNVSNGNTITLITKPVKTGYIFNGYYSESGAGGVKVIDSDGTLLMNSTILQGLHDGTISDIYASWIQPPTSTFTVTTTNLSANTTFIFNMSAAGDFYIDWGDGTPVQYIARTDNIPTNYSHTYTTGGVKTISFAGQATGYGSYSAIRFGGEAYPDSLTPELIAGVSGSVGSIFPTLNNGSNVPNFADLFHSATHLTSVPQTLFSGASGATSGMFMYAFYGCTGLTSVPQNLFSGVSGSAASLFLATFANSGLTSVQAGLFNGVSGAAPGMFAHTFENCSNLAAIPAGLFSNVSGVAEAMFEGTFKGCSGLTGSIPSNLFAGVTGTDYDVFRQTFYGTSSLSGYVPATLFRNVTYDATNSMMENIFTNSGIATSCDSYGLTQYTTGFESYWEGKVSCAPAALFTCVNPNPNMGGSGTISTSPIFVEPGQPFTFPASTGCVAPNHYNMTDMAWTCSESICNDGGQHYWQPNAQMQGGWPIDQTTSVQFYAHYQGDVYTVTLNPNGGTVGTLSAVYEKYNSGHWSQVSASGPFATSWQTLTSAQMASKEGYTLTGYWSQDGNTKYINADGTLAEGVGTRTFDANTTIYAGWEQSTYTISYTLNGGSHGTNHPTSGTYNSVVNISNPTHTNATFTGWTVSGMDNGVTHYYDTVNPPQTSTNGTSISTPTKATYYKNLHSGGGTVTFTAVWECNPGYTGASCATAQTYNLTWGCGAGSGTITTSSSFPATITYNSTLTFPANTTCVAPTGYTFTGWTIDIAPVTVHAENSQYTWQLTSDSAINAHFDPVKVNITYSCGTGATGTPSKTADNNIDYGSQVALATLGTCAKTGHSATKWVVSGTSDTYDFGSNVAHWNYTENKTLTPNWSAQSYNITYNLNGGTQASSGVPDHYTYGVVTTINGAPTAVGAEFSGWCDTANLTGCSATKTISATDTGPKEYWAKWTCLTGYEPNDVWLTDYPPISTFSNGTVYGGTACIPGRYHITCDGNGGVACLEQVTSGLSHTLHLGQVYDTYLVNWGAGFSADSGFGPISPSTSLIVEDRIENSGGDFVFTKEPPALMGNGWSWATYNGNYNTYVNSLAPSGVTPFVRPHYTYDGLWTERTGGNQYISATGEVPWASNMNGAAEFSRFFTSDSTVYAHWTPDVYMVALEANGGLPGTLTVVYEEYGNGWSHSSLGPFGAWTQITGNEFPTKQGYTFAGYYDTSAATGGTKYVNADGTLASGITPTSIGQETALYARWTENCNTVILNPGEGTAGSTAVLYKKTGDATLYTDNNCSTQYTTSNSVIPSRDGWTFRGFHVTNYADVTSDDAAKSDQVIETDGSVSSYNSSWTINGDVALYAAWAKDCTVPTNGTCTLSVTTAGAVDYTTNCNAGYTLSDGNTATPTCSANCNEVTLNPNGGNSGTRTTLYRKSGTGQKWYINSTCTTQYGSSHYGSIIPSRAGYKLRGFYKAQLAPITSNASSPTRYIQHTGATTTSGNSWNITSAQTLYAAWAEDCTAPSHGTCNVKISGNSTTYSASCDDGYTVSGATTSTPSCTANTITINWDENGGGAVSNGSCTYGDSLALSSIYTPTYADHIFNGWKFADDTYHSAEQIVVGGCVENNLGVYSGTSTAIQAQWCAVCAPDLHAHCTLDATTTPGTCEYITYCDDGYTISGNGTATPTCSATGYTVTYKKGSGETGADVTDDVEFNSNFTTRDGTQFTKTNSVVTSWATTSGGSYPNLNTQYPYATAGNTVLTANWGACDCTPGTHVDTCTVTGVTANKCQYNYACEAGYNNGGVTSGTFEGTAGVATNNSPNCDSSNSYTITITAGHGISTVTASGWTNSGTTTMTKTFDFGDQINLASIVTPGYKDGYNGIAYTVTDGAGSISNNIYTVGAGAGTITVSATGIDAPTAGVTGGGTKTHNYQNITLTGSNTTVYDNGITVKYSFGWSDTSNGTYGNWTSESTTSTTTVAKNAYRGTRYYKVKVTASDGVLTPVTTTSSENALTFIQRTITFNANGGSRNGTSPLYVSYNNAKVYTGPYSSTEGTIPTATKANSDFKGWFTTATGGSMVINKNGVLQASVSGRTNASSRWATTSNRTIYAQFCDIGYTANASGVCEGNIYSIAYGLNGGHYGTNHPVTATYGTAFTIDNPTHDHATFTGWNITGMDGVTHYYGANGTTTQDHIDGTMETVFNNLHSTGGTVTFTATWDCDSGYTGTNCGVDSYTVTYYCGIGATGNPPTDDTVLYGSTPTLPSTQGSCAKVGYDLDGWRANGESTNWTNGTQWTYTTDKTFTAQWTPKSYTMQYVCSDGSDTNPASGWTFGGTAPTATNPVSYNQNVTMAADPYSDQNGCRKIRGTQGNADYCDDCFTFGGWTIDAETTALGVTQSHEANSVVPWGNTNGTNWCIVDNSPAACQSFIGSSTFAVKAQYTPKQYDITYMYATSPSNPNASMPAEYTYSVGTPITDADQTAPAHATFNGWCTNLNDSTTCIGDGVDWSIGQWDHGDITYYANWSCDNGYTLSYNANNEPVCTANVITITYATARGSVPASTTCTYNGSLVLPGVLTAPGYTFDKWTVAGNEFNPGASITCNETNLGITSGSATITATWAFDPKFTVVTTNMTANDTFKFHIAAVGTFVIDWGDGSALEVVAQNGTSPRQYTHTYTDAGVHRIRVGGIATQYDANTSDGYKNPAIFFYNSNAFNGTPTKIASIEGSIGAVFPTLGNELNQIPIFYRTFEGATNMTTIPSTLFSGATGARSDMFVSAFKGCSKLTTIPSGLFSGISGAGQGMFSETFSGCSSINAIPSGLFSGINGAASFMFSNTFSGCSKITTIPSGLFDGVTGSAEGLFHDTFYNCSKLTTIPSGLFRNVSGGATSMFQYTFGNCPRLTAIPSGLFDGVTTAAPNMFAATFYGDTALQQIPSGLFSNVSGGASGLFWATFAGCTGLTGPIPANLFSGITTAAENEFNVTFWGATNLSGYVPSTLFSGLNGATATGMMDYIFLDTNLYEECPCGTHQYITGYEDDWSNKVSCEIGVKPNEVWYNNQCTTLCQSGATHLKTSNGINVALLTDKLTSPALNVKYNDAICYVPLESNVGNGAINIKVGNTNYHTVAASQTPPANFGL